VVILNLRAIARRILGRRGTFLLRNMVSEIAFRIGYYEDPRSRPQGITAMVITYNEEDWIEPSLLSIKDLVDEYVIMDSSTDRTPDIIEGVKSEHGLNIRLYRVPPGDLSEIRNEALRKTSYRWILHWDGDFVLYDGSDRFIRSSIEGLSDRRHYLIYWPWIKLCGDLKHICGDSIHIEHWLFTFSGTLSYKRVMMNGIPYDSLIAPLRLYKAIYIDRILGLHLAAVRKPSRLALKILWFRYREEFWRASNKGISYDEYAKIKAREVYGSEDLEFVGGKLIDDMTKDLQQYSGPYPSVLSPYLAPSKNLR
jgi:glycosyltransferase involved in cell wall biosynthesis